MSSFFLTAIQATSTTNLNAGDGATMFGANLIVGGLGNFGGAVGTETDILTTTGAANLSGRVGHAIYVTPGSTKQGLNVDTAINFAIGGPGYSTDMGFRSFIQFGKQAAGWPLDPNGYILTTAYQTISQADGSGIRPMQAAGAFDLWSIKFSGSAWRSSGVQINNTAIVVGSTTISQNGTVSQIDTTGKVGSLASVSNGGHNYQVGDQVEDGLGGLLVVDTVSSGVVTALHYIQVPYYVGTAPTAITAKGGSGNGGLGLTLAWTAASALSLQPSGGGLSMNGISAVSCSGTPTASFASTNGIVTHC